jgi:hypothetical protein
LHYPQGRDTAPVALIDTAQDALIRYATLRRRQRLQTDNAAVNQNADMAHDLGANSIRARIPIGLFGAPASFMALKRACR